MVLLNPIDLIEIEMVEGFLLTFARICKKLENHLPGCIEGMFMELNLWLSG